MVVAACVIDFKERISHGDDNKSTQTSVEFYEATTMLFMIIACSPDGLVESGGFTPSEVQYQLTWSDQYPDEHPDGGWVFLNDLGYSIHLVRGYVVSYSVRLEPCRSTVRWPILSSVAYAGHSDFLDASNSPSYVEDLLSLQNIDVAAISVEGTAYCDGVYTIARADQQTLQLPSEVDMTSQSLWLEGDWQREGVDASFLLHTSIPAQEMIALSEVVVDGEGDRGILLVQRDVHRLFDQVDFIAEEDGRLALQVLTNLSDSTMIQLRLE